MAKTIAVADQQETGLDRLKSQPQRTMEFLKDVRSEMRKVVAPTRAEVQSTTTIVIVTVFIFAALFLCGGFDFGPGCHTADSVPDETLANGVRAVGERHFLKQRQIRNRCTKKAHSPWR